MATQDARSMVSETSICNQALLWLGSEPITSLDQNNSRAVWMKNNYPFIRDAVMEERMWTFARARGVSTVEDRDAWDIMYVHPKPENWLSVFNVYRTNGGRAFMTEPVIDLPIDTTWRLEQNNILSKYGTIYFAGNLRVTDTGQFSALFVQALAARLAADAAVPLTENRQLQADMWVLYGDKLREAAARDGQQGANDIITQPMLTGSRYSGVTYG
jgi:hypothetical protein